MEATAESRDGSVWVNGPGSDDHLGWADHEAWLEPILNAFVESGSVFVDIGAHVGHWTVRMAKRGARVVSIECARDTLEALSANVTANEVDRWVHIIDVAAWAHRGTGVLTSRHEDRVRAGSTILRQIGDDEVWSGPGQVVELAPLDVVFPYTVGRCDVVKIDVEGDEDKVLAGARDVLTTFYPAVVIEVHEGYKQGVGDRVGHTMRAYGYDDPQRLAEFEWGWYGLWRRGRWDTG